VITLKIPKDPHGPEMVFTPEVEDFLLDLNRRSPIGTAYDARDASQIVKLPYTHSQRNGHGAEVMDIGFSAKDDAFRAEVKGFLSTSNQSLSASAIGFLSENPKELESSLVDVAKKMEKYDSFVNGRDINSKDREEISGFTDYLIYLQKLKIDSKTKISLKNLSELMDIKKSINLPNNLSLDVIKLRINSCLEVV